MGEIYLQKTSDLIKNYLFDKGLLPQVYKNLLKPNNKTVFLGIYPNET